MGEPCFEEEQSCVNPLETQTLATRWGLDIYVFPACQAPGSLFLLPWSRCSALPCSQALARVWLGTLKVPHLKKVCSGSCLGSYCCIVLMFRHRELTWCYHWVINLVTARAGMAVTDLSTISLNNGSQSSGGPLLPTEADIMQGAPVYWYESPGPTLGSFYSCRHMKVTACMICKNSLALTLQGAPWLLLAPELPCQAAHQPDSPNCLERVRAPC